MREAVIILPRVSFTANANLRTRLLVEFGGYTEHEATGAWSDKGKVYYDHNSVFTIAVDDMTGEHMTLLRDIAAEAGQAAGQISVYLKGLGGYIEFVNCSHT